MALTPEIEICAIIGAFIGCMIGTLGPYYKEKKRLGLDDVSIFFDKKFLKATIVAGILSAVAVGGAFPVILENVNPAWSYTSTVIFSATLALVLNLGGNIVLSPSLITEAANKQQLQRQTSLIFEDQVNTMSAKLSDEILRKQKELNEIEDKKNLLNKIGGPDTFMTSAGEWETVKTEDGGEKISRLNEDVIETQPVKKVEFKEGDNETNP